MTINGARVGFGFDAHRFSDNRPLKLCGVHIKGTCGLEGTSDADVALHAVIDALLGAVALGDIGELFPSSDAVFQDADSRHLLAATVRLLADAKFKVGNVDITIVVESVRISPYRDEMREVVAGLLDTDIRQVSVKATSTDGLGLVGRQEGIAAMAVAIVEKHD